MRTNFAIAALIYPMVQAVVFGIAFIGLELLRAPSSAYPGVILATFVFAVPFALAIAPRMRSRAWRRRHGQSILPS